MRTSPVAFAVLCAPLVLATAFARGQETLPAPPPTLHIGANLVLVDVVVTNHGKPMLDIAGSRFHVYDNGKERNISSFDEHRPSEPGAFVPPAALPPHTYTNAPDYPQSGAVNVLLLDALNTPIADQMQVRRQMIEYLGKIKPGTAMAIFTLGTKLRMVTPFTNDPASLLAILKKSKANPRPSPFLDTPDTAGSTASEMTTATPPATAAAAAVSAILAQSGASTEDPMDAATALEQFQSDDAAFQIDMRAHDSRRHEAARQLSGRNSRPQKRHLVLRFVPARAST